MCLLTGFRSLEISSFRGSTSKGTYKLRLKNFIAADHLAQKKPCLDYKYR